MENNISRLQNSVMEYENQLSQIKLAIASSLPGPDRDNLISLKQDIEELITLTKENMTGLQNQESGVSSSTLNNINEASDHFDREYALLKAELEESTSAQVPTPAQVNIQEDLNALQGMKCQAPHRHQWDDIISYHNALVFCVESNNEISSMEQIQVRVMFTNPTHQDMMPCPYYLEGECRFSDNQCRFSHGELVHLSSLKEYKEPNFSAVHPGAHILVKQNDNLWHRALVVTCNSKNKCEIKLESSGKKMETDLHHILPLDNSSNSLQETSDEGSDDDDDEDESDSEIDIAPTLIEQSLLRTPSASALGEWEKHTKGFGSRLMAQMGYVIGTGLGKNGEGRIEPVEALVFPTGKSLDHCMNLRENAGGDQNLFKVEKKLRRLQRAQERQSKRQYEREKQQTNVFDFINSKLGKKENMKDLTTKDSKLSSEDNKGLKTESCHGLNVVGFRIGEEIRRAEKDLARLQESLSRHTEGSVTHNSIITKLEDKQGELAQLRASERNVDLEKSQRKNRKKLTIF